MALFEYANTRVINPETAGNPQKIKNVLENTSKAQSKIWPIVQRFLDNSPAGPAKVSIIHAINDVFDIGAKRVMASFDFLPMIILFMLLFLACSALLLTGYNAGIAGHSNRAGSVFFVLFLAA